MGQAKERVHMLDILRGAALIGMVLHHSLVSYEIVFTEYIEWLYGNAFAAVQLVFVAVFLLVSGVCTHYSRNVLRRGIIVFAAAMLMTVATCFVLPAVGIEGLNIYFGILHMFGLSMVIYALLKKPLQKIPPLVGIVVFTALFIAYYCFYITEPIADTWWLLPFGVLPRTMASYGDYYPLFPYIFMFLVGTYAGRLVKDGKFPRWFYTARVPFLEFIGRKSLWIYVLHQPVIFPLMMLVNYLIS